MYYPSRKERREWATDAHDEMEGERFADVDRNRILALVDALDTAELKARFLEAKVDEAERLANLGAVVESARLKAVLNG